MYSLVRITKPEMPVDDDDSLEVYIFIDEKAARLWHEQQPYLNGVSYFYSQPFVDRSLIGHTFQDDA